MKLGKRYIALRPDGNGARGRAEVFDGDALHRAQLFATDSATLPGRVLVADFDSLAPASASEVEQHERPFIYHGEALARLGAPTPVVDEIERLRAENERMRAVCDLACEWQRSDTGKNDDVDAWSRFYDAIDAYRAGQPAQPTHASCTTSWFQCAHCNVSCCMDCEQPRANPGGEYKTAVRWCPLHRERGRLGLPQEDEPVTAGTLTPHDMARLRAHAERPQNWAQWDAMHSLLVELLNAGKLHSHHIETKLTSAEMGALNRLQSWIGDEYIAESISIVGETRKLLVSAIDKLRAARGSRP